MNNQNQSSIMRNGFEHNTYPHRVYPDWWLKEIPDPAAQLQADKEGIIDCEIIQNN